MNVEIISHNTETGIADIRFTHNGLEHRSTYDLGMVIPGTRNTCKKMGIIFDAKMQMKVIDKLTEWVHKDLESKSSKIN
jgi:hypothetical protein